MNVKNFWVWALLNFFLQNSLLASCILFSNLDYCSDFGKGHFDIPIREGESEESPRDAFGAFQGSILVTLTSGDAIFRGEDSPVREGGYLEILGAAGTSVILDAIYVLSERPVEMGFNSNVGIASGWTIEFFGYEESQLPDFVIPFALAPPFAIAPDRRSLHLSQDVPRSRVLQGVRISNQTGGDLGSLFIDEFYFVTIPEPGFLGLFGVGVVTFLLRHRRV